MPVEEKQVSEEASREGEYVSDIYDTKVEVHSLIEQIAHLQDILSPYSTSGAVNDPNNGKQEEYLTDMDRAISILQRDIELAKKSLRHAIENFQG